MTNGMRMTGVEFAYKQSLTFLPSWARGVPVFANVSAQRAIDDPTNGLHSYIPHLQLGPRVQDTQSYGPSTPAVARFEARGGCDGIWSCGLKGSF